MAEKAKAGDLHVTNGSSASDAAKQDKKRRRWDQASDAGASAPKKKSSWDAAESTAPTPSHSRWDETPGRPKGKLIFAVLQLLFTFTCLLLVDAGFNTVPGQHWTHSLTIFLQLSDL